ncbi:hypothetical protein BTE56_13390 [Agrobacterium pusense]|nr:hypothetical protein BTE56_13390 [Agrobacterium pusense]
MSFSVGKRRGQVDAGVSQERGRLKLMLRLPRLRGRLQLVHNTQPTVANLFEAYDEASSTLERLRSQSEASSAMLEEYLRICDDIESDVIRLCLEHDNPSH